MTRSSREASPAEDAPPPEAIDAPSVREFLNWLDEERRKQRALLAALSERAERQAAALHEMRGRLSQLESRLALLQAELTKAPAAPERILEQVRQELSGVVEQARQERRWVEEEAAKLRQHDMETQAKALESWRAQILARLESAAKERQVVTDRLVEQMTRFHNDLAFLHDRVAALTRRVEHLDARHEQSIKQLAEFERHREEVRRNQEQFLETLRLWQVDRRKEMDSFMRHVDRGASPRGRAPREQKESMGEARELLSTLRELEESLRIRRQEVLHLQKLSEDRLRQQLQTWRAEDERRWREMEARWGEWQKALAQRDQRLEELRKLIEDVAHLRVEESQALLRQVERRGSGGGHDPG